MIALDTKIVQPLLTIEKVIYLNDNIEDDIIDGFLNDAHSISQSHSQFLIFVMDTVDSPTD